MTRKRWTGEIDVSQERQEPPAVSKRHFTRRDTAVEGLDGQFADRAHIRFVRLGVVIDEFPHRRKLQVTWRECIDWTWVGHARNAIIGRRREAVQNHLRLSTVGVQARETFRIDQVHARPVQAHEPPGLEVLEDATDDFSGGAEFVGQRLVGRVDHGAA